jgi:hypothetical protein
MNFIDKQSRILFHSEFKVKGFDKKRGLTKVQPRYLDYNGDLDKFYYYTLKNRYAIKGKNYLGVEKLTSWEVTKASKELLDKYEAIKQRFSVNHIEKLWARVKRSEQEDAKSNEGFTISRGREEFDRFLEIYKREGENYPKILSELPRISPFALQKYLLLAKKSLKGDDIAPPMSQVV